MQTGIYFTSGSSSPIKIFSGNEINSVFSALKYRLSVSAEISDSVRKNIAAMDAKGFGALQDYSLNFDRFALTQSNLRIVQGEIREKTKLLAEEQQEAIDFAFNKTFAFQQTVSRTIQPISVQDETGSTSLIPRPLNRVGIYVPGGLAPLPSSLMMAGVSAKAAGVKDLIVCTPPRPEGLNPAVAYLAEKLEINEIYLLGGVAAIWFMANGLDDIAPVEKICGPGNAYVAEAKSQLAQSGKVGIDMVAGPSEVLIIADKSANPEFVAADLLAQAEHGPASSAVLITDSNELAISVQKEVYLQLQFMKRKDSIAKTLDNCGAIFLMNNLIREGSLLANDFAPEHLEFFCGRSTTDKLLKKTIRAGAVFIGTGEAFADYGATGGNHILPTGGTSRFSSGLSARDFFTWTYFEKLSDARQAALSERVSCFADMESLEAHSSAARIRKSKK